MLAIFNVSKTKVMVFRKGGVLHRNMAFYYNGERLEIANLRIQISRYGFHDSFIFLKHR